MSRLPVRPPTARTTQFCSELDLGCGAIAVFSCRLGPERFWEELGLPEAQQRALGIALGARTSSHNGSVLPPDLRGADAGFAPTVVRSFALVQRLSAGR